MSWKVLMIVRGQAAPPITTRRSAGGLPPLVSRCCSNASHTVGTAAVAVTWYLVSNSKIEGPSSLAPGITRLAPIIGAVSATDQPLAWNIGTTGMTTSRHEIPNMSVQAVTIACSTLERCEYTTPFGLPVVPEV